MLLHETLECRRLLSASVEYDAVTRALSVYGSLGPDDITVTVVPPIFDVPSADDGVGPVNEFGGVSVWDGERLVYHTGAPVASVDVFAFAGNDRLAASTSSHNVAVRLYGHQGNDVITLTADAASAGVVVFAGAGNDLIHGSACGDTIFGEAGNDMIFAGDGDDRLLGGVGDDILSGEDGDDFLDHGGGTDLIDGGNGFDRAIVCNCDEVFEIELFLSDSRSLSQSGQPEIVVA